MTATASRSKVSPGILFEYRLARLRFVQGYFVRRSIDIWPAGLQGDKLAELDCLAVAFDPQLQRSLEVVECKTRTRGQGEIDRLVWLKGMGAFAGAKAVTFAKPQIAPRAQQFASLLGVQVLNEAAIGAAEAGLNIAPDWWPGFHDPEFGERVVKPAREVLNGSPELRRVGKYLFGSFWFTDDFTRVKQLHTFFHLLAQHAAALPAPALRLGVGEATTLLTLTVLSIASWLNQFVEDEFRQLVEAELSTGLGDPRSLRTLLRRIDGLQREQVEALHAAYQQAGAGRILFPLRSLEAEILTPPEWVGAFINLVQRFWVRAYLAMDVMRFTDVWAAGLLGAPHAPLDVHQEDRPHQAALDLVRAFLTRQWGVPDHLFAPAPQPANASPKQLGIEAVDLPSAREGVEQEANSLHRQGGDASPSGDAFADDHRKVEKESSKGVNDKVST